MKIDKLNLLSKGWSAAEIEHASKVIQDAEDKKHIGIKFLESSIYWTLLFLLLVATIVCSTVLTPFIFAIRSQFIIIITAVMGFLFGTLFSILIADIEKIEHKNHKNLLFTLVFSGVINAALIINFAMDYGARTKLTLTHNPYLIAGIFLFSYLIPHMMLMISRYDTK